MSKVIQQYTYIHSSEALLSLVHTFYLLIWFGTIKEYKSEKKKKYHVSALAAKSKTSNGGGWVEAVYTYSRDAIR